jgi:hypothetical protein
MPRLIAVAIAALVLAPAVATADAAPGPCLKLDQITVFAPRNEVYVRLATSCEDVHFEEEDPVQAYVEVMVSDLPPVGRDVRLYREESARGLVLDFRGLGIHSGEALLVRLVQNGEIVDLRTVVAP